MIDLSDDRNKGNGNLPKYHTLLGNLAQVSRCHIAGVSNQTDSTAETKRQLKSRKCSNGEIRLLSAAAI